MTTILKMPDRKEAMTFYARLLCLLVIGALEFLLMIKGKNIYVDLWKLFLLGIGGSLAVFWGITLLKNPHSVGQRDVCLGIIMVAWFLILELLRRADQLSGQSVPLFLPVYMIVLPFAAVSGDSRRQLGLRAVAGIYLAAAAYLIAWSIALFVVGEFSGGVRYSILWSESRLRVVHHPNILARVFMIAICLNLGFLSQTGNKLIKGLLLGFTVLLFAGLALTNSRACILVTAALFGANVFFRIWKGGTRGLIPALAGAAILTAVAFLGANMLFQWNGDRLMHEAASAASQAPPPAPQGSWTADMPTLNNRTLIWLAELNKIRDDPWILLRGTETTRIQTGFFEAPHSHNAWLEVLMRMGLPGLLLSLVFSWNVGWASLHILWNRGSGLWKKNIAMLVLAMMVTSMLEPFLFATNNTNHFFDIIFFLCLGYITLWSRELKG